MKEIVSYVYGSFNDYLGKEHKIIVCGVTTSIENDEYSVITYDEYDLEVYYDIQKTLKIGLSICNPNDEYDQQKGEFIAYNRALSEDAILLTSSRRGMFNTATVNFLLNDYLAFVERDPGSVLKGYDKAKLAFQEKIDILDDINKMKPSELEFLKRISEVTPEQIKYAIKVCKLLDEK